MNRKTILQYGKTKLAQGLAAGIIGVAIALLLFFPGALDYGEYKTWDWRVRVIAKPTSQTEKIRLILLDQNSLDWGKNENGLAWPWPREVYGTILQFCKRVGARALFLDVLMTEPSKYGVEDDRALAADILKYGYFIGTVYPGDAEGSSRDWPSSATNQKLKITGIDTWLAQTAKKPFTRASFPVEQISAAAALLSNVHMAPDYDNVYRRVSLFESFEGRILPSPALALYLAANPDVPLKISPGQFTIGRREIPIDKHGQAILNFRGPSGTHKTYSAASIIQSELRLQKGEPPPIKNLDEFRGTYVLFGFSAPGLFDLRPAPVSGIYPGVEVHATMLDNLLTGDFIKPAPIYVVTIMTLFITILAGLATSFVSGIFKSTLVYILFIATPVIISLIAARLGFWLPMVVQETGVFVTLFGAGLIYYTVEGRQKAYLKNAFKQYLSHAVIEELIRNPERLKLGGEKKELSVLFSDLEGFTGISEGLEPEALTDLLNRYLTSMTDIIHDEGGTIDKYEGDAIIAFWNAPLDQPDHAVRCVRAALRCQRKLAEMRPDFRKSLGKDLKMRIGINSGKAVVGNMGSKSRFDYTMIGDAVNLASRLEGINKQFGTYMLISQTTRKLLGDTFPVREVSRVTVVGRREPVVVYEPMWAPDVNSQDRKSVV